MARGWENSVFHSRQKTPFPAVAFAQRAFRRRSIAGAFHWAAGCLMLASPLFSPANIISKPSSMENPHTTPFSRGAASGRNKNCRLHALIRFFVALIGERPCLAAKFTRNPCTHACPPRFLFFFSLPLPPLPPFSAFFRA